LPAVGLGWATPPRSCASANSSFVDPRSILFSWHLKRYLPMNMRAKISFFSDTSRLRSSTIAHLQIRKQTPIRCYSSAFAKPIHTARFCFPHHDADLAFWPRPAGIGGDRK
jgi:hypothetical protein